MADYQGAMVFLEAEEGKLSGISLELLGAGRKLAKDLGQAVSGVLVGSGVRALASEAIAHGADKVYVADDAGLANYVSDTYVDVLERLVKQASPSVLLMGQTGIGRDLAPRLAFRLGVGLSTDCIDLSIDRQTKNLLQTRPVYGGNARAVFATDTRPQMATVRQKAMSAEARDPDRKGEVAAVDPGLNPAAARVKFIQRVKEAVTGVKLEDAEVVVAGGRGLGGPEGFKQLEELAKLMRGAIGATRSACDNGWVPCTIQVGLTGKVVTPNLYIAVALSGASQHMAGCSGAKTIVAINKDPEANIFKEAQFGVVGDYKQVIPALAKKIKELVG
ncbi:MAG: electron transfer flavoprotein subunit alpha/FixB family protein [Chloroflexi bacterium]|nr:electron transfer flavoprotein subunit alpha/FixB family protein [Chloroflexota bacterium]